MTDRTETKAGARDALALAAVCLAALMFGLEISSVPVILPSLEAALGVDFQDMQWIMNAYTIACTTVLMATGVLADRFGRRRVFLISVLAFGVTSLACGLAGDASLLIVARFAQGMAGGAMFICSVAILSHQFQDGAARGRAFAIWGVVAGIGLGFGPLIGGGIAALSAWRWVFLVHAPLAVVALLLIRAGVAESRDPHAGRLDVAGIAALTATVLGLTWCITQGSGPGFGHPLVLGAAAATVASFAVFLAVERFGREPMFDFSIFRIRNFTGAIMGCIGMNFSYWPFMIYLPIYFSAGLGYDSTTTGLALLAYTVPFLVMPPVAQYLLTRHEARRVIPGGLFVIGLGFLTMQLGGRAGGASTVVVLAGALLAGIGLGLTTTPVTNTTTGSAPANRAGMASGIDTSARLIALAINIAVMGLVLMQGVLSSLRHALPEGVDAARVRSLAERIASGSLVPSGTGPSAEGLSDQAIHQALMTGFDWVMLYGGLSVWVLAALSFAVLNPGRPRTAPLGAPGGTG